MKQKKTPRSDNPVLRRAPLQYGKKLYVGEFVAEQGIRAIAFLSIAFIIAIFFYVFREAGYAFLSPAAPVPEAVSTGGGSALSPESYSDDDSAPGAADALRPVTYGADAPASAPADALRPATYGADVSAPASAGDDGRPSAATDALEAGRAASASLESTGSDTPVRLRDLAAPNDTIEGIPTYVWQPIGHVPKYSIVPLAIGALKVTLIGLLIAAPIAILAAIFTTAFAPKWMREVMKPAIEILAGFPSVVIGFFCLITVATVAQEFTGSTFRLNSFVGGIGMALAVIPIVFTVTEDAFAAVPKYMKEASLALGASRWQTAWRVVLPAATPGVFAALILGFGRAFGETMIALMATGNAALVSADILESVRTMAATIGAEMAEVEFHSVHYGVLFLIGAVLFAVTFTLNAVAEFYVRRRLLKKFQGN